MERRRLRVIALPVAGVVVVACLVYLVSRFHWQEPFRLLRQVNLLAFIAAIVPVHFAYIVIRTLRWQAVVRDQNPGADFASLYWITAIVVSLAILTPGQIGETVKVELLRRRGIGDRLPGFGSFALERIFDVITVAAFGLIGLLFGSGLSSTFSQLPILVVTLLIASVVMLYLLSRPTSVASSRQWLALLRSGTGTLAIKGKMLALTVLSWFLVGLGWQICLRMIGIEISLPAMCWLVSIVTVGQLLSLMPGGIGLADVVTIQALIAMGAPSTSAQAAALILRAYGLIGIAFGLCHLLALPFVTHRFARKARDAR